MSKGQIDKLVALAKKKKELINRLYTITKIQVEQIVKEDIERINEIIDKKDRIMKEVDQVDISFLTIFSQLKKDNGIEDIDQLSAKRYPNLLELKTTVKEISSQLMAMAIMDEKNQENIKETLEATKAELRRLKKGKKAYKGYNVPIVDNILIDEKK